MLIKVETEASTSSPKGFYKLPGRELEQARFRANLGGILLDKEVRTRCGS